MPRTEQGREKSRNEELAWAMLLSGYSVDLCTEWSQI